MIWEKVAKLSDTLQTEGINVTLSSNDADTRIVQKTVERAETAKTHVVLVRDDTDLLVLALHAINISGVQQKIIIIMRQTSDSFIDVQMIY